MSQIPNDIHAYTTAHAKWATDHQRRRALKIGHRQHVTADEWLNLLKQHNFCCLRCGTHSYDLVIDHIIPVDTYGSNTIDNIQPLCRSCNSKKQSRTVDYRPLSSIVPFAPKYIVRP